MAAATLRFLFNFTFAAQIPFSRRNSAWAREDKSAIYAAGSHSFTWPLWLELRR